ncbi:MAG: DNA polymerase IV, partial [Planctomycetota bacterium]
MKYWDKVIMHVDMDAFFASVEQLDHPEWRGKPVIVGGPADSRGVVSAASYEAREFGVHSAMPMASAKLRCPHAVFVTPNGERYHEVSMQVHSIFENFTPLVEPISVDEAFLDVTGSQRLFGPPLQIAKKVKRDIKEETGLTASVGIAPTKFVAKLASDLEKPDGLVIIKEEEILDRLAPLEVGRVWGVGKKFQKALAKLGIYTIGEARNWPLDYLESQFGASGTQLYLLSRGIDPRTVETGDEAKSISNEYTFSEDITDIEELRINLEYLTDKVATRMRRERVAGRVVTVKVRYDDFRTVTRRKTLHNPCSIAKIIQDTAFDLMVNKTDAGHLPVRLIGVGMSDLVADDFDQQTTLFGQDKIDKIEIIEKTADVIRDKIGKDAIRRGVFIAPPE